MKEKKRLRSEAPYRVSQPSLRQVQLSFHNRLYAVYENVLIRLFQLVIYCMDNFRHSNLCPQSDYFKDRNSQMSDELSYSA